MPNQTKTILIVDDEPDVLDYLSTFLRDNGYAIETTSDGAEAMLKVKANRPDLITLDITMPEQSGVRFYRNLKEDDALKTIPVVIITGVSGDFEKFISTRKHVPPPDGYIQKPIDLDEVLKRVKALT